MTQPVFRGNGTVLSYGVPQTLEVDDRGIDVLASGAGWFEQVSSYLRVAASANEEIEAVFVSTDGRHVVVSARAWSEELSRTGARLIAALLRELKPDAEHWVEGGFTAGVTEAPQGSACVYRRDR